MRKMFVVMKREYLQTVRKKSFIIMTLLFPFLMAGIIFLPVLVLDKGMGKKRIAVLDATGQLEAAFAAPNDPDPDEPKAGAGEEARKAMMDRRGPSLPSQITVEYVKTPGDPETTSKPYLARMSLDDDHPERLEGVFVIPAEALTDTKAQLKYYSRSATDMMTQQRMSRLTNKSLQGMRLSANGIRPELVDDLLQDLPVEAVQLSRSGDQKTGGELNIIIAFVFGALLMLPSFLYGQETMRGIVQEKSDRVVEVLISSVSPVQLLTGKIIGIAAVGLTQIVVWLGMVALVGAYGQAVATMADINLAQFIRPMVFVHFFVFFILAYLTYVCIYAIAGAVCNTEKEAQQFIAPIMMLMMVPWFLMMPIIMNPDAPFAVIFSLAPVFGPITMFVRAMVTEPPLWHILVSIGVSLATITFFFWITAKIFRVGILSYGKRPTIPEIIRWMRAA